MKKLVNLKGVKTLSRIAQRSINGGSGGCWVMCNDGNQVQTGHCSFAGWACMPHGWTICTC